MECKRRYLHGDQPLKTRRSPPSFPPTQHTLTGFFDRAPGCCSVCGCTLRQMRPIPLPSTEPPRSEHNREKVERRARQLQSHSHLPEQGPTDGSCSKIPPHPAEQASTPTVHLLDPFSRIPKGDLVIVTVVDRATTRAPAVRWAVHSCDTPSRIGDDRCVVRCRSSRNKVVRSAQLLVDCGFAGRALHCLSPALEEIPVQNLFPTSFAFSHNSSCHPKTQVILAGVRRDNLPPVVHAGWINTSHTMVEDCPRGMDF